MTRGPATLKRALELLGSKKALCAALWLSYEELEGYLRGEKPVPQSVIAAAAEIIKRKSKPTKR